MEKDLNMNNTTLTESLRYQGVFTPFEFSRPPIDEIWLQRRKREQRALQEGTQFTRRFPVDEIPPEKRGKIYLLVNRRGKIKLV